MIPLIDADVLRYEVGAVSQDEDGPKSFDYVIEVLTKKINEICRAVIATEDPILFITGDGNFREEIAVTKKYKGNRTGEKPYHFKNITAYMKAHYELHIANGCEADDLMAAYQTDREEEWAYTRDHSEVTFGKLPTRTIICTRDKDLRMVPGWHYGWECGKQFEFGPKLISDDGYLELITSYDKHNKAKYKLIGGGMQFFWAQMLMGDDTDNIPGCPGIGVKKAWEALEGHHPDNMWPIVRDLYYSKKKDDEYILEQGRLLWMCREFDDNGPVMWELPDE